MGVEKQYIDLFAQHEALIRKYSPAVMNEFRLRAFEGFQRIGFPSMENEDYKYTDVQKAFSPDYGVNLNRLAIPFKPEDVFRCDVPNLSTWLYFMVNDSFYEKGNSCPKLPKSVFVGGFRQFEEKYPEVAARYYGKAADFSSEGIVALNTMLAQDAFVLYVPEGVVLEKPLQLINILRADVDLMVNRRILIIMEPRSEARLLVCEHSLDKKKFLTTQVVEIFVEEGALLDYYELEETHDLNTHFSSVYVEQEAKSNVLVNGITLMNGLSRNNYFIKLNGEYAESTLCGMSILDKQKHVDVYSHVTHSVPNCHSTELFKNVLNDQSIGSFCARILVKKDAQKTRAYQSNRNLCTSREARMYSKPQLEIYADDVKCSHGMTTGQLDENALFYMRSRGIPESEARMMLSVAFTADVLDHIRLRPLQERLHQLVEKRFRGELATCSGCRICR
ncbi:MAG: Fe-S cluster assembly protein SufD [Massilibacteroides sp.]|nr:Fe-S cluster assembly protein SufD [Massilibacteroides sp.]MDD3061825.1 Fe-S cluster assembly protein SufD [Massilibacteroides sp.]MDD4114375.1 Fe-S cluster assembly protein SufD [Massilibacteroides sp.]MDD4660107.1 Fe-S cluster assembly protein SufD [Massilibacteroides sp.]